jgi:hypothetical protein
MFRTRTARAGTLVLLVVAGGCVMHPASAVMGLVTGTEGTKVGVATGEYNEEIDARIAEIKNECHLNWPDHPHGRSDECDLQA